MLRVMYAVSIIKTNLLNKMIKKKWKTGNKSEHLHFQRTTLRYVVHANNCVGVS